MRILFFMLMIICPLSWAEWERTAETGKMDFYHDKSTIRRNGLIAKMWALIDYQEEQSDSSGNRYKSQKVFRIANCGEEIVAVISFSQFSGSMGNGESNLTAVYKESEWIWVPISPGSIAEKEWKIACNKK